MAVKSSIVSSDLSDKLNIEGINIPENIQCMTDSSAGKLFNQHLGQELEVSDSFKRVAMKLCLNTRKVLSNSLSHVTSDDGKSVGFD